MPSFYTPDLDNRSTKLLITGSEYNHIVNVFRKRPGDEIKLNSGHGFIGKAVISQIRKKEVVVELISVREYKKSTPEIAVAFSLLRNKNDNLLVEKLTELGVKHLYPFTSENSVRKPSKNTITKFEETCVSAIKQCDNPFLPECHEVLSLKSTLNTVTENGYIPLIASELEGEPLLGAVVESYDKPFCIFIGPEGGFSPDEFEIFKKNKVVTYSLCNRVLRAETAAITAIAQMIAEYMKLNPQYQ